MGPFWLKLGCPYSQNWFQYVRWDAPRVDPTTIQTVSKPYPNHIRPSYQQSLGGHLWPKLVHFGPPRTTNGGALFPIFLRTIDIQCWTRFCKKLAIFGNFFVIFGPSCHLKLCLLINMFCDCDFHQLLQINDTLLCQKCLYFV